MTDPRHTLVNEYGIDNDRVIAVDDALSDQLKAQLDDYDLLEDADSDGLLSLYHAARDKMYQMVIDHGTSPAVDGDVPDRFDRLHEDFTQRPTTAGRGSISLVAGMLHGDNDLAHKLTAAALERKYTDQ